MLPAWQSRAAHVAGIRRLYRAGKGVTERELARIAGTIHKQEQE